MMEGSDQEGGSPAASMEETSANGEYVCGIKTLGYFGCLSLVLIGPTYVVVLYYYERWRISYVHILYL